MILQHISPKSYVKKFPAEPNPNYLAQSVSFCNTFGLFLTFLWVRHIFADHLRHFELIIGRIRNFLCCSNRVGFRVLDVLVVRSSVVLPCGFWAEEKSICSKDLLF